ncbi:LuxR family transcriptional regulator, partial [Streptomyces griseus]|nr:LuxR family transcriptional regulator [Streptomyces griseus]
MKDDHSPSPVCDCRESPSDRSIPEQPCEAALAAYRRALTEGCLPAGAAPPCLRSLHLMVADQESPGYLIPVPPETASFAALAPIEEAIVEQRRTLRSARATLAAFEGLYAEMHRQERPALTRLSGTAVIGKALDAGASGCRAEVLSLIH